MTFPDFLMFSEVCCSHSKRAIIIATYFFGVIVYEKTDEWYIEWQRVTANGTTSENEWRVVKRVVQRVTTNDNKWSFRIRDEPTTKRPKENPLNLEEDFEKRRLN